MDSHFSSSFQGNVMKATSILHKAQALNARPAELLEVAISNLKAGVKQLLPTREEEHPTGRDALKNLSLFHHYYFII